MKNRLFVFIFLISALVTASLHAEEPIRDAGRLERIKGKLDSLAVQDALYLSEIDASVNKMPMADLLRNVAKINEVSLSAKSVDNLLITCNFSRIKIIELIHFLCKEYNLDIDITGNIVSIFPYQPPLPVKDDPKIDYDKTANTLSYDLIGIPLTDAAQKISHLAGINIVVPQNLYAKNISAFANKMELEDALYYIASSNDLEIQKNKNKTWLLSALRLSGDQGPPVNTGSPYVRRMQYSQSELRIDSMGYITVNINRGNVYDILFDVCEQLNLNYFFITPVNAQTSLYLKQVDVGTLFHVLFTGTTYSYTVENGVYMFGTSVQQDLVTAKIIRLKNRTVNKLQEAIPTALKNRVQISVFPELNSIIASGDQKDVFRLEQFLHSIDQTVPLVTIEVIIVDVTKSLSSEAGVGLGLGSAPAATDGSLSPGVDMTLGASSINKLINSFNGFGSIRLGKVSQNFYMDLKLLEEKGDILLRSTPKLSTLNGNEAVLKSGETKYYKELNESLVGSQNPIISKSYTWKQTDANLSLTIIPYVGEDDHITLDISIEQSEFTDRVEMESPPGKLIRSFKSVVRLKNEEVVLLGGIDKNSQSNTSSGIPVIARIPILKWLFGKSSRIKKDVTLNVFIKPTIIYQ